MLNDKIIRHVLDILIEEHGPTPGGRSQEALEELDRKPYPSLEGIRNVIKYVAEQNPKAANIKAEEIVDTSWLKKLDGEGFFEKVYGGK